VRFVWLVFIFFVFAFVRAEVTASATGGDFSLPALVPRQIGDCGDSPENNTAVGNASTCIRTYELGDCGSIRGCTKFIGLAIYNIGAFIVWIVLFIIDLVVFVIKLGVTLTVAMFEPIPDAPPVVGFVLGLVLPALLAVKIFRLIRSGDDE
jgi:hypothetical protein